MLAVLTTVCLPILLTAGLGWLLDRRLDLDLRTLVRLNLYLFVPAFIFVRVYESALPIDEASKFVAFTLSVIVVTGAAGWTVARLTRAESSRRRSILLGTMFYNCGNFGIPLVTLAFGAAAQQIHVFALMTMNVSTFSLGLLLASGGRRPEPGGGEEDDGRRAAAGWRAVLRQPSIHAIAAALVIRELPWDLRAIPAIWQPLNVVASALVGFALVTLGVQLAHTRPPSIAGSLGAVVATRLIVGPLVAAGLARLYGFDTFTSAVLVAGASAPTAINTALIAHEFDADSGFAAAVVFYSTLASLVTVTVTLFLVRP